MPYKENEQIISVSNDPQYIMVLQYQYLQMSLTYPDDIRYFMRTIDTIGKWELKRLREFDYKDPEFSSKYASLNKDNTKDNVRKEGERLLDQAIFDKLDSFIRNIAETEQIPLPKDDQENEEKSDPDEPTKQSTTGDKSTEDKINCLDGVCQIEKETETVEVLYPDNMSNTDPLPPLKLVQDPKDNEVSVYHDDSPVVNNINQLHTPKEDSIDSQDGK